MDAKQATLKKLSNICVAAMGALLVLSAIYYKERVLFADASYVAFSVVNYGDFAIQFGRYGSFITQLFPYIGQKLHLPLQAIVFLYGISFNTFYLAVVSVLVYCYKQYRLAILTALFYFLFVSQSFIWVSEIPQGMGWLFLCFGTVLYLGQRKANLITVLLPFTVFGFLALFTHFVIIIPAVFLWVYFILDKRQWPFSRRASILLSCVLIAIIAGKFVAALSHASATTGDAPILNQAAHFAPMDLLYALSTYAVKKFLFRCVTNYWIGTLFFIAGIAMLLQKGKRMLAAWTLLTTLGYLIIMGRTYAINGAWIAKLHIESEWMCIGVIIATPIVYSFSTLSWPRALPGVLIAVFIVRLAYIGQSLPEFTKRMAIDEQVLGHMRMKGINKLTLYDDDTLRAKTILDWAMPYESLLMSQMHGDRPQLSFVLVSDTCKTKVSQLAAEKGLGTNWGAIDVNYINSRYFNIDTTQTYQPMTFAALRKQ